MQEQHYRLCDIVVTLGRREFRNACAHYSKLRTLLAEANHLPPLPLPLFICRWPLANLLAASLSHVLTEDWWWHLSREVFYLLSLRYQPVWWRCYLVIQVLSCLPTSSLYHWYHCSVHLNTFISISTSVTHTLWLIWPRWFDSCLISVLFICFTISIAYVIYSQHLLYMLSIDLIAPLLFTWSYCYSSFRCRVCFKDCCCSLSSRLYLMYIILNYVNKRVFISSIIWIYVSKLFQLFTFFMQ